MFDFLKKIMNKTKTDNIIPRENVNLYIVMEEYKDGLIDYLAANNIYVKKIYTDLEDAKIGIISEPDDARLVIIEQGKSRFTNVSKREDIIDLLGLCDGISKKATVFYTNNLLKGIMNKKNNVIQYFNYVSTVEIKSILQNNKETFKKYDVVDEVIDKKHLINSKLNATLNIN